MQPAAEPNVTPLIDVMLVLLIICMVALPVAHHTMDASLPQPPRPGPTAPPPAALFLLVEADGLRFAGMRVADSNELETRARDALALREDKTVYVRAAGEVSYGSVVTAIDAVTGAGATRIGIVNELIPAP